jgi:hypothetical protein
MYKSLVGGANVAILNGTKYEAHHGNKVTIGDATHSNAKPLLKEKYDKDAVTIGDKHEKYGKLKEDGNRWQQDGKNWSQKIADLGRKITDCCQRADKLKETVDSANIKATWFSVDAGGDIIFKSGGDMKLDGKSASLELTGSHAQLKKGGQSIECTSGNVTIRGSEAKWE